jgi:ABC-type multidrug transport system fused ATPase/permease subunit
VFLQTLCWEVTCERQVNQLRHIFFAQILRQDLSWYDCNKEVDITTKLSDDLERVREGMGSKCSFVIQYVSTFIAGIVVGFITSWKLTLIVMVVGPFFIAASAYLATMTATSSAREQEKYGLANKVADQVLNNLRTVLAFGKQDYEIQRFDTALEAGRLLAMKKYLIMSVCLGIVFFLDYVGYGLAFWFGAELISRSEITPGSVFTVFFSVLTGAFSLGQAMPYVSLVSTAIGAASTLFAIIDRVPDIDPYSDAGIKPQKVRSDIELRDVTFAYPARSRVKVLDGINLKIKAGETVALVGESGSGKSTIVSLVLRFYDPAAGQVLLDGVDIRKLNVSWLRSKIGVVSQEPSLFGSTIYENISYGHHHVKHQDVVKAAMMANAHSFISALPKGYDTVVGGSVGSTQLSGGQKQRIAIARALIRDPPILLLDEATSALDSKSEQIVKDTLRQAAKGRTTIIVAHRLSTVFEANHIYVLKDGLVREHGTHSELLSMKGHYFRLVQAQRHHGNDVGHLPENRVENSHTIKKITAPVSRKRTSSVCSSIEHLTVAVEEDFSPGTKGEPSTMWRLLKLNSPEWKSLSLGILACACTGAIMPVFAIFYGEMFDTFQLSGPELKKSALFWTVMFVVLAFGAGFCYWCQTLSMTTALEKLVKRLRVLAFSNILCQPVSWMDEDDNSPYKLCTKLARDAPLVKSIAGLRAGQVLSVLVTSVTAFTISFVYGWKLALMLIIAVPLLVFASYYLHRINRRYQQRDNNLMDLAGKVASESILNIRTVQSLGKEYHFRDLYLEKLVAPLVEAKKQALAFASVFAFSQAVTYAMYAGAFHFGAYLIENGDMVAIDLYRVFFAMAFSAQSVGLTTAYLHDYTKARMAAEEIFCLIDRCPEVVKGTAKPKILGRVTFRDVHFRYPNRPTLPVLRGLNLEVRPGQTVALVGASGCGKSTIMALLQCFYSLDFGQVMVDGHDVSSIEPDYLRRHMGLVTQEPVLFDCSLRDNIAYGSPEPLEMADIVKAASSANIHDFITSLPQGYDTMAGNQTGVSQLSGGQKQRIAIARALVRNPCILLLDEATSALDAACEKVVQSALDTARQGRTCIIIAHRLSTVQNADSIAVIHRGQVVEQGTHEFLMELRGMYYELVKGQGL